jgi:3-deoxy-manno-octulosonate cytidylyltransferase (CMP-KDO synthetase)
MIKIEEMTGGNIDVVVMVQGDEPMITPEMITDAIQPFDNADTINVVNLMANIKSVEEFEDPNEVKVVVDNESNAVYFSREPIPSRKKGYDTVPMLKQVCVIPFKRDYLLKFNKMEETELERIESVDMMRIIENGEKVHMVLNDTTTYSVDTEQDKRNVENSMVGDLLLAKYKL